MSNINQAEKANFKGLIESDGLDRLDDRLNILNVFLGTEEHVTLSEFENLLKEKGYNYEPDFIRSCMNRMVELGFAQRLQLEGQAVRYEHRHLGRHHDHLICTKCGKIVEFAHAELERIQLKVASEHGFHTLQHQMDIYGICSVCLSKRRPQMPLAMVRSGERVIISEMAGGRSARGMLAAMGLRVGDEIEVINNAGQGRLILGHACTRLAVGRGIAQRIMVSLSSEETSDHCQEEES